MTTRGLCPDSTELMSVTDQEEAKRLLDKSVKALNFFTCLQHFADPLVECTFEKSIKN